MKNITLYPLLLLMLSLNACHGPNIQVELPPDMQNQWQPILLSVGETYQFQTQQGNADTTLVNLALKQAAGTQLKAWWELSQRGNVSFSTQLTESADNLLISSKAALITEPSATALVNTVLMDWWSAIDYLRWEIAYKRELQTDMSTVFILKVIAECDIASFKGSLIQLASAGEKVAEACIAPTVPLPLSVTRYRAYGTVEYSAIMLNYQTLQAAEPAVVSAPNGEF